MIHFFQTPLLLSLGLAGSLLIPKVGSVTSESALYNPHAGILSNHYGLLDLNDVDKQTLGIQDELTTLQQLMLGPLLTLYLPIVLIASH